MTMTIRHPIRYTVAALCLCTGLALPVYSRLTAFTGEICVAVGTAESIAIRPASPAFMASGERVERLPGSEIPFATSSNGRGWIDGNRYYDVAALPFALAVGDSDVGTERQVGGSLVVRSAEGERHVDAAPGVSVKLAGQTFTVTEVRPWQGLVAAPGNPAMAALTVTHHGSDDTTAPVFLPERAWVRFNGDTALHFAWVDSSDAAQTLASAGFQDAPARWGIVENGRGEWLSSFQPGSGLTTEDGGSVILIQQDDEHPGPGGTGPAIEVAIGRKGETERRWIRANEEPSDSRVRYEDLARMPVIVDVIAWENGAARVRIVDRGTVLADTMLNAGETWTGTETRLSVRLDDVRPAATAVYAGGSVLTEVVLDGPERQLRVPEHEPLSFRGSTLRFTPEITPARVQYTVATFRPEDDRPKTWRVGPGDTVAFAGWELRQKPTRLTSQDTAVFQIRKMTPLRVWIASISLVAVGALLLTTARRKYS